MCIMFQFLHSYIWERFICFEDRSAFSAEGKYVDCGPISGIYKSLTDTCDMNVEIGTEAAQFPEKEYINGIFVAVKCVLFLNVPYVI